MLFRNIPSVVLADLFSGYLAVVPESVQTLSHPASTHSEPISNLASGDDRIGMRANPFEDVFVTHPWRSPGTVIFHSRNTMTHPLGSISLPTEESIPPKELSGYSWIVIYVVETTAFGRKNDRPMRDQLGGRPPHQRYEIDNANSRTQTDKLSPSRTRAQIHD